MNYRRELEAIRKEVEKQFGALDEIQLNAKPNEGTWSIAQNLDHLIVVNETYFPILAALREGNYQPPWHGRFRFLVNYLGNMILKGVNPSRKRKFKTFAVWEPSQSELPKDVVAKFLQHQKHLMQQIESTEDIVEKDTVIASPANKKIVYTLEKAFHIIIQHEKRHLQQAREVYQAITRKT